jgi:hypothetical protein
LTARKLEDGAASAMYVTALSLASGCEAASVVLYRWVLENKERWLELCALAAEEQDSAKLMELVAEINALLDAKEQRLKGKTSVIPPSL